MAGSGSDSVNFSHFQFELLGSFILTFVVCWSRLAVEAFKLDYIETALATGLTFSVLATLALKTSGGHYNPAVSLALVMCDKMTLWKGLTYIMAHLIGSFLAASAIAFTAPEALLDLARHTTVLGLPRINSNAGFTQVSSFVAETCGSAFIMAMYWSAARDETISVHLKGYLNGVAVTVSTICFYNVSGGCFNPIYVFGPSMISRTIREYHWVYWFGPIVGMLSVALGLNYMEELKNEAIRKKKKKEKSGFVEDEYGVLRAVVPASND